MANSNFLASQKLWRVIKQPDGYYYEIKLAGMVIDRFKIPDDSRLNLIGVKKWQLNDNY